MKHLVAVCMPDRLQHLAKQDDALSQREFLGENIDRLTLHVLQHQIRLTPRSAHSCLDQACDPRMRQTGKD
jgi:hypothetical protein